MSWGGCLANKKENYWQVEMFIQLLTVVSCVLCPKQHPPKVGRQTVWREPLLNLNYYMVRVWRFNKSLPRGGAVTTLTSLNHTLYSGIAERSRWLQELCCSDIFEQTMPLWHCWDTNCMCCVDLCVLSETMLQNLACMYSLKAKSKKCIPLALPQAGNRVIRKDLCVGGYVKYLKTT